MSGLADTRFTATRAVAFVDNRSAEPRAASRAESRGDDPETAILQRFLDVRAATDALCRPLQIEDYGVQTMDDVSPPKWHIAHVTWFFETFLIKPHLPGYREFDPLFDYLFNSYYVSHGRPYARPQRGLLSRPTVERVYRYRAHVDAAMTELLSDPRRSQYRQICAQTLLGLHHEQQHQELLLTDIKHILAVNPLRPVYRDDLRPPADAAAAPLRWHERSDGLTEIGADPDPQRFSFDCETPRHRTYLQPHALASRPVSNDEYLAFVDDGGYRRAEHWLSAGWDAVNRHGWRAPLYWHRDDGDWWQMTLSGPRPLDPHAPVCHVSFFEADAYARWAGKRLPSEAEWESAAAPYPVVGNLRDADRLHPAVCDDNGDDGSDDCGLRQLYGDVWEWTQSSYSPYPGFRTLEGTLGEYNGKFMCSQMVLRGGSCFTPADHIRASYRNFFYPADRWQCSGLRLADDR